MPLTAKQADFLADAGRETPYLVVDLDSVAENYRRIAGALGDATVFYAMKANPAREIMELLVALGSSFDCASLTEVEEALAAGATPERIAFGNTIKKGRDIAAAYALGVRRFAFDSDGELEKIAAFAPGSAVWCRLLTDGEGADWPLNRKFGCDAEMAEALMRRAVDLGLEPAGLSFHVGSQQRNVEGWDSAIAESARIWHRLAVDGIRMHTLNLGGGLPARYGNDIQEASVYGTAIRGALTRHFGNDLPELMIEPGRAMVGDAGVIQSEVILISRKSANDNRRWVYLDIGKFGGLAETMDEAIKYPVETDRNGPAESVVIAGPTCDSADVLYDKADYRLPVDLKIGDRLRLHGTGAYTTTYASVGFNGFAPLKAYYI